MHSIKMVRSELISFLYYLARALRNAASNLSHEVSVIDNPAYGRMTGEHYSPSRLLALSLYWGLGCSALVLFLGLTFLVGYAVS